MPLPSGLHLPVSGSSARRSGSPSLGAVQAAHVTPFSGGDLGAACAATPVRRSTMWIRHRPTRQFPSMNGWMVSNWACAIAAWASGGMSSRARNVARSSRGGRTSPGGGSERCAHRAVEPAAEPVLDLPGLSGRRVGLARHQRRVDAADVLDGDGCRIVGTHDRLFHGADIGCNGACTAPGRTRIDQCPGQVEGADLVALDPGRRDGSGPEQQWSDRLQPSRGRPFVQFPDRPLGLERGRRCTKWHLGIRGGDRIEDEGVAGERSPGRPAADRPRVAFPPLLDEPGHRSAFHSLQWIECQLDCSRLTLHCQRENGGMQVRAKRATALRPPSGLTGPCATR